MRLGEIGYINQDETRQKEIFRKVSGYSNQSDVKNVFDKGQLLCYNVKILVSRFLPCQPAMREVPPSPDLPQVRAISLVLRTLRW